MSVVDHFDKPPEVGFSREWDAEAARRQFNVSLGLIAALAFAVGILAFAMRPTAPAPTPGVVHSDAGSPAYGRLVKM